MGYGMPAAVAMKRLYPERTVVCIAGDGDFLMNGQEFATAVQYDLPIVVVLADNSIYGTIRMHQEREYPGRVIATDLKNPDFAAYARAFGGFGVTVEKTADFPAAFAAAVASGKPAIVHLQDRPGSDHADHVAHRHPREGAGGARLITPVRAAPRWRCAPVRRTRRGTLRRAPRRQCESRRGTGSRSTAACGSWRTPRRSTIRAPD